VAYANKKPVDLQPQIEPDAVYFPTLYESMLEKQLSKRRRVVASDSDSDSINKETTMVSSKRVKMTKKVQKKRTQTGVGSHKQPYTT
jgi:hypothetical protein